MLKEPPKVLCVGVVRLGVCNIFFGGPYNQLQSSGSAARKTYLGFNQYVIHPYSGEDQEKSASLQTGILFARNIEVLPHVQVKTRKEKKKEKQKKVFAAK